MYAVTNYRTKKALKDAVKAFNAGQGPAVKVYAPGLGTPAVNGTEYLEGPHYPEPHRWYAQVTMRDGNVVSVK